MSIVIFLRNEVEVYTTKKRKCISILALQTNILLAVGKMIELKD